MLSNKPVIPELTFSSSQGWCYRENGYDGLVKIYANSFCKSAKFTKLSPLYPDFSMYVTPSERLHDEKGLVS